MILCRCDKCKKLNVYESGETLKCRACGGEVYFLTDIKKSTVHFGMYFY